MPLPPLAPGTACCPNCGNVYRLPDASRKTFQPTAPTAAFHLDQCISCGAELPQVRDFGRFDGIKHMSAPRFTQLLARLRQAFS